MAILETQDLKFLDIIEYPNITIAKNGATFLTGKSGSGKSTLLRLFNRTVSSNGGTILYNGTNIQDFDSIMLRREIMLVPQSVYLFDGSIEHNFREFYAYREEEAPSSEEIKKYLDLCLASFPLEQNCATLSGGERQRVFLALFLSFSPKVLLLDEPTSALDGATANQLLTNLKAYCKEQGITLLIVSHDPALANSFADFNISLKERAEYAAGN